MCGITGIIYKNPDRKVNPADLERANNSLIHRGPDDSGMFIDTHVGLAMRRLSIIDLAGGRQPISNEDDTIHIVYNGELYNYLEIRDFLKKKGHYFKTRTDTESILHLYEEKGLNLFEALNGMFAFAIWDRNRNLLLLARDRLGIKPLFYYEDQEKLIFASEIKSILQYPDIKLEINYEAIIDYLVYNYIPAPKTIFKYIRKLPPASYLSFTSAGIEKRSYWSLSYNENQSLRLADAIDKLEELLYDAVKIRLMSEVPLGAFLSGGIDSSTLAYIITRYRLKEELHTFSIGFNTDSVYNELPFSQIVADQLATQHHTRVVSPTMVKLLPEVSGYLDEPMSDTSNIPTYLLSQYTREFVTVALSGDGGDELFAGYERQFVLNTLRQFYSLPGFIRIPVIQGIFARVKAQEQKDSPLASLKRIMRDISQGGLETFKRWVTNFNYELLDQLLHPDLKEIIATRNPYEIVENCFSNARDLINQSLCFETKYYLPDDLLVKVDRMSMAHSLEVRVPFLDHRIVEFATSLPVRFKIRRNTTKFILKKMMKKHLAKEIIKKPKQGFTPPIKEWLNGELKQFCQDLLLGTATLERYLNREFIERMLRLHYSGQRDFQYQLWSLLVLAVWLEKTGSAV